MGGHAATYPVPRKAKNSGKVYAMLAARCFKADTLQECEPAAYGEHLHVCARFSSATEHEQPLEDAMDLREPESLTPSRSSFLTAILSHRTALGHLQVLHYKLVVIIIVVGTRQIEAPDAVTEKPSTVTAPLLRGESTQFEFRTNLGLVDDKSGPSTMCAASQDDSKSSKTSPL